LPTPGTASPTPKLSIALIVLIDDIKDQRKVHDEAQGRRCDQRTCGPSHRQRDLTTGQNSGEKVPVCFVSIRIKDREVWKLSLGRGGNDGVQTIDALPAKPVRGERGGEGQRNVRVSRQLRSALRGGIPRGSSGFHCVSLPPTTPAFGERMRAVCPGDVPWSPSLLCSELHRSLRKY
jgi:hypothetical protein